MSKLTKLERLKEKVADTYAEAHAVYAYANAADVAEEAAWVALVKAKRDLFKYLKEQDNA